VQNKIVEWLIGLLLSNFDAKVAAKFLVGALRAIVSVLKDVFTKTATPWDDAIGQKLSQIVEEIAKALNVP
jgi:hypothetical protein